MRAGRGSWQGYRVGEAGWWGEHRDPLCPDCFSAPAAPQGKRVIGEDGAEGYSDLFRENALLQKENGGAAPA